MINTVQVRNVVLGAGVPKVVVPITGRTKEEIPAQAKVIADIPADLAEWRADFYKDLTSIPAMLVTLGELRGVLGDMPIIFTVKAETKTAEALKLLAAQSKCIDLIEVASHANDELVKSIHEAGCLVIDSDLVDSYNTFTGGTEKKLLYGMTSSQEKSFDIYKVCCNFGRKKELSELIAAAIEFARQYAKRPFITEILGSYAFMNCEASVLSGSCVICAAPKHAPILKEYLTSIHGKRR